MTKQYLEVMMTGLKRKIEILSELYALSEKQTELAKSVDVDWDAFDILVNDKSKLIDELDTNDSGFEQVYLRVKDEINANKNLYKNDIIEIQHLIGQVTEKSTSLMALEQRNKINIENAFKNAKQRISQSKKTNTAAASYYRNMSKINYIDPQLMEYKK